MAGLALRAVGRHHVEVEPAQAREPGPGEVRVAVERCGICGSDLHWFLGRASTPDVCPGHEISGVVAATGPEVRDWKPGDAVAIEPIRRCSACAFCARGDYHLCKQIALYGVILPGGMASTVNVPAYCLHRLPAGVDTTLGALAEPMAVAVHALRLGGVDSGTDVLVLGAGTIGLVTVAAARFLGARSVAVTARHPHQKTAAERLGCDEVLAPERPRAARRPSVVIETVGGHASTVSDGVGAVAPGGTVVITGLFEKTPEFDPMTMMLKEVRLVASMVYNRRDARSDFEIALEILADRASDLRTLVTHELALTDAQRGFETAADKSSGAIKVLLVPSLPA